MTISSWWGSTGWRSDELAESSSVGAAEPPVFANDVDSQHAWLVPKLEFAKGQGIMTRPVTAASL
jgi:hypothetical protein